ncbi:efflux RND transporter periplasmic adaptor subunit [Caulobacter sp. S45]|uniref:efflux RND transporter periplasmic adaptor subunit n=1 Tax=Caulobacter sp. S45 TaxID=1641861 RepID=UPI00157669E2|nr:efflux RND transporter periplasmic adaptor subunit [Caulobacter sp. S45]
MSFLRSASASLPAALLASSVLLAGCNKPAAKTAVAAAPLSVSVTPVRTQVLRGGVTASGLLIPKLEAAVSTELSGYRVAKVFVDQDAQVAPDQPLAQLDDTLLRAQIAQQQAMVDEQKVASERSVEEAKRVSGLDNQGVLPQEQIVERRLAARSAGAGVAAAQAQLNDLLTRERMMTVRAPVGGRVLERTVRPGDIAAPTMVMYRIAADNVVELNAEVSEADLAGIHPGDHATVTLPDNASVDGVVRVVSPEVDAQTKLGHVRVTLPVRADLRPGGYGRATFTSSGRSATVIPESALRFDADGASVMTLGSGDVVRRIPVRTGAHAGGLVELLSGPQPGQMVLLGGGAFVLDGDKVNPVRTDPGAPAA